MVQKKTVPVILNTRVYRLFKLFDELYEFGATGYFTQFKGIEFGRKLFNEALKDLDNKAIQMGIDRMKSLEYRKRVFPEPRNFYKLCTMSDKEFEENKFLFEYERYEY